MIKVREEKSSKRRKKERKGAFLIIMTAVVMMIMMMIMMMMENVWSMAEKDGGRWVIKKYRRRKYVRYHRGVLEGSAFPIIASAKPMAPIGSFPLLHILLHHPHDRRTFLVYWDDEWWKIWMISIENFYTPLNLTHLSHFVLIASNYEAPTVDQDLILWRWSLIPFIFCSWSQA